MPSIIYIHVPKCGGSTFSAALRLRFLASQASISLNLGDKALLKEARILSDYAARQIQLRSLVAKRKRLITGHVQYDPALHANAASHYKFVTILRDPVERFVSHYNYLQRNHPDADRAPTLELFLDTEDARRIGSQYAFYFGGQYDAPASRAVENLSKFSLVGDLSEPGTFAENLKRLTGARLLHWKRNAAPYRTLVPRQLRRRVEDICANDIAIYEGAKSSVLVA